MHLHIRAIRDLAANMYPVMCFVLLYTSSMAAVVFLGASICERHNLLVMKKNE